MMITEKGKQRMNLTRMQKARAGLIASEPFFGSLATKFNLVESTAAKTSWTDGKTLAFNPEWLEQTSMPELEATVAHHVLSCAFGHHLRRGERDKNLWQEASDYVVNLELQRAGFQLPAHALIDPQYDKMFVEQVFALLKKRQDESEGDDEGSGPGGGPGGSGAPSANPDPAKGEGGAGDEATGTCEDATDDSGDAEADAAEREAQAAEWKEAAAQAAQVARGAGRLPGGIERGVKDFLYSRVDWREALQRLLKSKAKEDHSWLKPSRRSPAGFFMPGRESIGCGPLAFFIDASGSIRQNQIDQAVSEIEEARVTLDPESVIVYMFDTQVRGKWVFARGEAIEGIVAAAGGGTTFDEPIYELERDGVVPEVAIYLTDLDARVFAPEPAYPVVWLSTLYEAAPYGDVIVMQ